MHLPESNSLRLKFKEKKMTVSLPAHKPDDSNQLAETSLPEKVRTHIAQLEDLVARRRKIRSDVIKSSGNIPDR